MAISPSDDTWDENRPRWGVPCVTQNIKYPDTGSPDTRSNEQSGPDILRSCHVLPCRGRGFSFSRLLNKFGNCVMNEQKESSRRRVRINLSSEACARNQNFVARSAKSCFSGLLGGAPK
jgi:hypothetical protein